MKRVLKIGAAVLAVLLILGLGWMANGLLGNPVCKYLAKRNLEAYLAAQYPGQELVLEKVGYSFKTGGYEGYVVLPGSRDVHFSIDTDGLGNIKYDRYESLVTSRFNTYLRLMEEYRCMTDPVLDTLPGFDFGYGDLAFDEGKAGEYPFTLTMAELELDGEYDVRELGSQVGVLIIYVTDDAVTTERAAELLLSLREAMDRAGVPFRFAELTLRHEKQPDSTMEPGEVFARLSYEELTEDGLTQRVEASNTQVHEEYAQMDKERMIDGKA